jgi:tetraacyldisaccharide 4'-kinase
MLDDIRERAKRTGADFLITTEKDAGKITIFLTPGDSCWALRLYTDIPAGRERLEQLMISATAGCTTGACA